MTLRKASLAAITAAAILLGLAPGAGALTFSDPIDVSPPGLQANDPPVGVINDDGSVTLVWRQSGTGGASPSNPSNVGKLQASRSTTPGVAGSWSAPVDIATVKNTGGSTHLIPRDGVTGSSLAASYPRIATDPTRPGWIYMVYLQGPPGPTPPAGGYQGTDHYISYDSQVWFQRSKNRGLTWSPPVRVSDPAETPGNLIHQTRQPNITVSPLGRINIVWQDRRHWYQSGLPAPGNNALNDISMERQCTNSHRFCHDIRLGDTYYATSMNGGDSFSADRRISDRSHNNDVGYDVRPASGYWSWGPQVVTLANERLLIGWMDSREGNWDNENEDYYLATLDHTATGADPETFIDPAAEPAARSVQLANRAYPAGREGALSGGPNDPANAVAPVPATAVAARNASSVVIVNETDTAGAMAGTVLARANPGPVLLSPAGSLPASVTAEIQRIRPASVFIIGGTDKLSAQVQTDAAAAAAAGRVEVVPGVPPVTVTRIDGGTATGATDAAIAAAIPQQLDYRYTLEKDAEVPAFDAAVIANPATPDAAAAVGLAAARRLPILYVNATGAVPAETAAAINTHDIKQLLVVGGTDEVSDAVVAELDGLANVTTPTRLGGATVYDTSKAVVNESKARGMPSNIVYVADGANPMDATLLSGVVARATGMLVLRPAPLHENTQAGLATDFGLTEVDRYVVLGPARAGAAPTSAAEARVSPNYRLASDPSAFRGRDMIGLAVSRTNPQHAVSVNANMLDLQCEASMSTDGGATWSTAVPLLPPEPGPGQAAFNKRCDWHQSVQFGSGTNVYAIAVAPRTTPAFSDNAVIVYKSPNGGLTWERGVIAMEAGPGSATSSPRSNGPNYTRPAVLVQPGVNGAEDRVYAIAREQCAFSCNVVRVAVSPRPPAPPVDNTPPANNTPPADTTPPADNTPPPAPIAVVPPPPEIAPVLSKVSLTRRSFKARLGTSIRLTLSKAAKVRVVIARRSVGRRVGRNCVALTPATRRRTPCVRYVTRGTLTSSRKAGASTLKFSGRVAGRFLARGGYRFTLQATDSGNRKSKKVNVTFTVVR